MSHAQTADRLTVSSPVKSQTGELGITDKDLLFPS